jgi:hypothetical protein
MKEHSRGLSPVLQRVLHGHSSPTRFGIEWRVLRNRAFEHREATNVKAGRHFHPNVSKER